MKRLLLLALLMATPFLQAAQSPDGLSVAATSVVSGDSQEVTAWIYWLDSLGEPVEGLGASIQIQFIEPSGAVRWSGNPIEHGQGYYIVQLNLVNETSHGSWVVAANATDAYGQSTVGAASFYVEESFLNVFEDLRPDTNQSLEALAQLVQSEQNQTESHALSLHELRTQHLETINSTLKESINSSHSTLRDHLGMEHNTTRQAFNDSTDVLLGNDTLLQEEWVPYFDEYWSHFNSTWESWMDAYNATENVTEEDLRAFIWERHNVTSPNATYLFEQWQIYKQVLIFNLGDYVVESTSEEVLRNREIAADVKTIEESQRKWVGLWYAVLAPVVFSMVVVAVLGVRRYQLYHKGERKVVQVSGALWDTVDSYDPRNTGARKPVSKIWARRLKN